MEGEEGSAPRMARSGSIVAVSSPPPELLGSLARSQSPDQASRSEPEGGGKTSTSCCVVCLVEKPNVLLAHGSTAHKCVCKGCSEKLKRQSDPAASPEMAARPLCPMCRAPIDLFVDEVF